MSNPPLPYFSQLYKEAFPAEAQSVPSVPRRPYTHDAGLSSSQPVEPAPELLRLEAEKQALAEELDKVKNLYELKLIVDSKKDDDILQLRRELDRRQNQPPPNLKSSTSTTKGGSGGWDLTGLLRDGAKVWSSSRNSDTQSQAESRVGTGAEITKLREALTLRSKQLMQTQSQLEEMENYLHREREAFQAEVDNRNRRIQEIKAQWEREKEISANIMREKLDLAQQVDQNAKELQRRENWVKDLTARVNRQEAQISALETEIDAKRNDLDKANFRLQRLQYRVERYEANLRVFQCHRISPFQKTPVTMILQQMPQTGSFVCILQLWDQRQVIEFYDILGVQLTNVPSTSIGRWTFRGISGRIMEWWGSDLVFVNNNERLVPKRAAFFGDYSFDQVSNHDNNRQQSGRQVKVLVLQTRVLGTIAFSFEDDDTAEECHQSFQYFMKCASMHERELRENQRTYCLCEMEAFMYGDAGEEPPHPPVRSLPGSDTSALMQAAALPPIGTEPRALAPSPWTQQALSDTRSLRAIPVTSQHERLPSGRIAKLSECASETATRREREVSEHDMPRKREGYPPLRPSPSLGPSPSNGSEPAVLHRRLPPFGLPRPEYVNPPTAPMYTAARL